MIEGVSRGFSQYSPFASCWTSCLRFLSLFFSSFCSLAASSLRSRGRWAVRKRAVLFCIRFVGLSLTGWRVGFAGTWTCACSAERRPSEGRQVADAREQRRASQRRRGSCSRSRPCSRPCPSAASPWSASSRGGAELDCVVVVLAERGRLREAAGSAGSAGGPKREGREGPESSGRVFGGAGRGRKGRGNGQRSTASPPPLRSRRTVEAEADRAAAALYRPEQSKDRRAAEETQRLSRCRRPLIFPSAPPAAGR